MRFSICIPTYEMRGKGVRFLDELFQSLTRQTFKDFEVIVSDHSKDARIKELCEQWHTRKAFSLRYLPYALNRDNASSNRKNAVNAAKGDIIKPLDQDDFMYDIDCLKKIDEIIRLNQKASWGIVGWIHTNEHSTEFSGQVIRPTTSMSMDRPSIIFYKNEKNTHLTAPLIIEGTLIAVRIWPFQASRYILRNQLSMKERQDMMWLSAKRLIRKYILNPLEKKS